MRKLIPHDLIRHLEWENGSKSPVINKSPPDSGSLDLDAKLMKYIQVGIKGIHGKPVVISPFELDGFGGLNYDHAHFQLNQSKLYMPTPKIFMTHFMNVVEAFNDRKKLLYADGTEVPKDVVEDIYKHQTTNHKAVYGREPGVWTWLNGMFLLGSGARIELETVIGFGSGGIETNREPLKDFILSDKYVPLEFNEQGLPIREDSDQNYRAGQNVRFWYPRNGRVARFYADSGRAVLSCGRDPTNASPSLGVFGCAEGTSAPKTGGSG